ncbi:putative reverse transcriptase zinc-binding domain-containing protein [Helianthus annuus]|nr:putative reverse transcriptase zinc-binding domain-containing protein [Helianthus annuus]KAJ0854133.1 putative reverse transcriptase zinc-binding domain-containing protein [Helianthus annuus]
MPKSEGGLGIRSVLDVNRALMAFHIHSIISRRRSLWVEWVRLNRLKDRSFWDIPDSKNACWSWRKSLQVRPVVRQFFWTKIGNGESTSLWYDKWCEACPLSRYVSPRQISREGLSIYSKVADVVSVNEWRWPEAWRDLFPILFRLEPIQLQSNKADLIVWKDADNKLVPFTTKLAWDAIRRRQDQGQWAKAVWTSFCIPRHAFHCWLVFRRKLWTQDRIRKVQMLSTGSMNMMCCLLCFKNLESHSHLLNTSLELVKE